VVVLAELVGSIVAAAGASAGNTGVLLAGVACAGASLLFTIGLLERVLYRPPSHPSTFPLPVRASARTRRRERSAGSAHRAG
jgi:hypothetical protein